MLPKYHHPHDEKWIKEQLSQLPVAYIEKAINSYDDVFKKAWLNHADSSSKNGVARREANTRLREYVKRVKEKLNER